MGVTHRLPDDSHIKDGKYVQEENMNRYIDAVGPSEQETEQPENPADFDPMTDVPIAEQVSVEDNQTPEPPKAA